MATAGYARTPFSPTRFPAGVGTANAGETLQNFAAPDPTKLHTFFTDFDTFLLDDWTITEVGAAGTQALAGGDGGTFAIVSDALANDGAWMQLDFPTFLVAPNKRAFFKIRLKVSDALQTIMRLGLISQTGTPLTATDGIFFTKVAATASLGAAVQTNTTTGSTTVANVGTLVTDTFITLGFEYDGKESAVFYVDDVVAARLSANSTYRPDALLSPTFGMLNGNAGAKTLTVDYVFAALER